MPKLATRVEHEVHRPDFGVRLIIIFKLIKVALLVTIAITAFTLVHRDVHDAVLRLVHWFGLNPGGRYVGRAVAVVSGLAPTRLVEIGIGAIVVAIVWSIEAWGLHRRRVWAEYLTITLTTALIPLELYELVDGPSLGKVLTLVANVAIVIYLARNRILFAHGRVGRWLKARFGRNDRGTE